MTAENQTTEEERGNGCQVIKKKIARLGGGANKGFLS